jgi:uncharacterized membrane protein
MGNKTDQRRWIKRAILILSLPTSFLLLTGGFNVALNPEEPAFRPVGEVEAAVWMTGEVETGSVVLGAYNTGNALPAWTPVRVVVGHGPESSNLETLLPQVSAFFGEAMTDRERIEFIDDMDIEYVWYGPNERELGSWDPTESDLLIRVYGKGDYEIYQTNTSP